MTGDGWTPDLWEDCWQLLVGAWATLRREGAQTSYRAVLTRFPVGVTVEAVTEWVAESVTEPTPADLAAGVRRHLAAQNRRPVVAADDEPADPEPRDEASAWNAAKRRHERGATLGFSQWVALGCPPDPDTLPRVAATLSGAWGAYARAAMRASSDPDRALALRRLAHVMSPDDHAVLTDAVMP